MAPVSTTLEPSAASACLVSELFFPLSRVTLEELNMLLRTFGMISTKRVRRRQKIYIMLIWNTIASRIFRLHFGTVGVVDVHGRFRSRCIFNLRIYY